MSFINASCTVSKLFSLSLFLLEDCYFWGFLILLISSPNLFMVSWYLLGLICCSESLLVVLTAAALPDPVNHGCLQSVESTAFYSGSTDFPWVTHPPVPFVPSVSWTWSVRCCLLLCFVDPAKQHPRAVGCTGDRNKHERWSWWDCKAEKSLEAFLFQEQR